MFFKNPLHPKTETGKSNVNFYKSPIECFRSPSVAHISEIRNKLTSSGRADPGRVLKREFSCKDRVLTARMGGELGDLISRLSGSSYRCIGTMPIHSETVTTWYGYQHNGGISDSNGKRWWTYQKCKISGYQTAWWKVERLLVSRNDVNKASGSKRGEDRQDCKRSKLANHKDYYRLLCVDPSASQEQIQKNHRCLVKRFHPDLAAVEKDCELEIIKAINEAYETLSDPSARLEYDQVNNKKGLRDRLFGFSPLE